MPVPATAHVLSQESQKIVIQFLQMAYSGMNQQFQIREMLRQADLTYMREVDRTIEQHQAALRARQGDPTKYQNVVVPIVLPQVESAVTYQAAVFLQGYPMFGVVGTPEVADAALMMDTAIGQQQDEGAWRQEFIKTFRDGMKYNLMAVDVSWCVDKSFAIGTDSQSTDAKLEEVIWEGNKIKWLDLYNTFWDTRVKPAEVASKGEFAGYTEMFTKTRLKQLIQSLPKPMNQDKAYKTLAGGASTYGSYGTEGYYMPTLNPTAMIQPQLMTQFNWSAWAGIEARTRDQQRGNDGFQVTTLYARICPEDMKIRGIPGPDVPQVWKFIIVNNQVVVYAERMTNAHGLIPVILGQPNDDGLGYQTKSLADNVKPFQAIATAFTNALIAGQRKAVGDRMIYDPSRISASVINSENPASKMPIKPNAFGQDLKTAVLPIPFDSSQLSVNLQAVNQFSSMANMASGLNPARQGQFIKGNKTRGEFDTIMANSNGRDELVAISIEDSFMAPIKKIIKANILQYQGSTSVYNREQQQAVTIDPVALRKANLLFKISDGKDPSSKLIDADALTVAFQTIQSVPAIGAGFNVVPMFSYLMKSAGAKINSFEKPNEQVAYEQAAQQWMMVVGQVAQAITGMKDADPQMIQDMLKQLPPQPTPQQFNWNPEQKYNTATDGQSILSIVTQATSGGSSQPSSAAGGMPAGISGTPQA